MYINMVYKNDNIILCHKACKACWGKPLANTYLDMCKFIENRVKVGHESVLEHSNIVLELVIDHTKAIDKYFEDILDLTTNSKYLNLAYGEDRFTDYILIGGSIRAYKELIRNAQNPNSQILNEVLRTLVANLDKCYFVDFIDAGLCNEDDFYSPINNFTKENSCSNIKELPLSTIENIDDYNELIDKLIHPNVYCTKDLYRMLTITINFKDLSRSASHQLVRHRNGITQSSMRYIDMSNTKFNIPPTVQDDKYELNIYGNIVKLSYEDILKLELNIYEQLRYKGVAKEDARGILGMNTTSKDLYMTFTYMTFIKFLQLRTDIHAQYEIRERALELYNYLVNEVSILPENLYDYLIPNFEIYVEELKDLDNDIDETLYIDKEEID